MIKENKTRSLYFPDRLKESMDCIFEYSLIIVEAPMGYGKTTAVREHLKRNDANILWLRVFDNSINGFWKGFSNLFVGINN